MTCSRFSWSGIYSLGQLFLEFFKILRQKRGWEGYGQGIQANLGQGVDIPGQSGYISKAVEGNSDTETTEVAPRANSKTLNLDNYIV